MGMEFDSSGVSGAGKAQTSKVEPNAPKDVKAKELPPTVSKPGAEFVANNEVKEAGKISLAESLGIKVEDAAVLASVAEFLGFGRKGGTVKPFDIAAADLTKRTLDA
jgi:hypothetical protein